MNEATVRDELPALGRYIFGTTGIGRAVADFDRDLRLARTAMDAGVWFHVSQEYGRGGTFMILRHAFDQDRRSVPPLIAKVRCDRPELIRFDVEDALRRLGIDRVDVAQLCRDTHDRRRIVDDFLQRGPMWRTCLDLKRRGLVGNYLFEVFRGYSQDALKAVENDLFDGCILYLNPCERQADNALEDAMRRRGTPRVALRTMGGRMLPPHVFRPALEQRDDRERLARLAALEPVFESSGCEDWVQFAVRFALSLPNVPATVGGTSSEAHLHRFVEEAERFEPLDPAIVERIESMHRRWDERGAG